VRDTLTAIQAAEEIPPEKIRIPSDLTFMIQRGDLRSFVAAIQFEKELNPWDAWFARLESAGQGKSIYVWEDGLARTPFCILIRHVFLWLDSKGFFERPQMEQFVQKCLEVQDAPVSTILATIPSAWDKLKNI
jgi:hypothetical protein